jgi:hypothetical protein
MLSDFFSSISSILTTTVHAEEAEQKEDDAPAEGSEDAGGDDEASDDKEEGGSEEEEEEEEPVDVRRSRMPWLTLAASRSARLRSRHYASATSYSAIVTTVANTSFAPTARRPHPRGLRAILPVQAARPPL